MENYLEDDFHAAIMDIIDHTTEAYPGTNIIGIIIEKMDAIVKERVAKVDADVEVGRKKEVRAESDARAKLYIAGAAAEEDRITPKHFKGEIESGKTPEEIMEGLAANVGQSIRQMTADSVAHCDKFIDRSRIPINMQDLKKPWDEDRINETREKLRRETITKKAKEIERIGKSMAPTQGWEEV